METQTDAEAVGEGQPERGVAGHRARFHFLLHRPAVLLQGMANAPLTSLWLASHAVGVVVSGSCGVPWAVSATTSGMFLLCSSRLPWALSQCSFGGSTASTGPLGGWGRHHASVCVLLGESLTDSELTLALND